MKTTAGGLLKLLRIVNLPTVPGDVLVGAAAVAAFAAEGVRASVAAVTAACVASCGIYLFGLVDNDLVGAATDGPERPIPAGEVSPTVARLLRGIFLFMAMATGALANLLSAWWIVAFALAIGCVVYNRTKNCLLMGLCRALNVLGGGFAVVVGSGVVPAAARLPLGVAVALWAVYIAIVTKYSEGEEANPAKRRRVGALVGGIVYLQLAALLVAFERHPSLAVRNMLLAGAAMLLMLRLLKRLLPKVSAS